MVFNRPATLRTTFAATFSILALIALVFMGYLYWLDGKIVNSTKLEDRAVENVRVALDLQIELLAFKRHALLFGLTGDRLRAVEVDSSRAAILQDIAKIRSRGILAATNLSDQQFDKDMKDYFEEYDHLKSLKTPPLNIFNEVNPKFERTYLDSGMIVEGNRNRAKAIRDRIELEGEQATLGGSILSGVLLLSVISLLVILKNNLFAPLLKLREAIGETGKTRSLDMKVELTGAAELRDIGQTFNEMTSELKHQREAQFRFVAAVAHDVKSPVAAMKMAIDQLLEDENLPLQERTEMLKILNRQTVHLRKIVDDLMDTAAVAAGQLRVQAEVTDLSELVRDATTLQQRTSTLHRMALQIDRGDYRTLIDPTRIRQVLNNLIGNAIKYSPRGGDIQVRLYREDRRLVVSVSDQGIGIAAHEIGSVFEPFKRSQNVQHSTPGLGLGLSICRQILRAHYGDIEIQSLPGKGTTVSFWLPLSLDLAAGKESQASL